MQMKNFTNRLDDRKRRKLGELLRFGIVGVLATLLQYAVYLAMLRFAGAAIANTVGYAVSFVFNFLPAPVTPSG